MTLKFAQRLDWIETSAIRELFKLLGKPGIISFAGGFPDARLFDVAGIAKAGESALKQDAGGALQYGATEGYQPLRQQISDWMVARGAKGVSSDQLIVTTGSQQALDLIGKTMISPGDTVIVEGPTFLATIQCFRLYGANVITVPTDGQGVEPEALARLIEEHKPKLIYLIPTFGNPSGATLSLERRLEVLRLAVQTQTLLVEDDPYGDLYFDAPPPPSLMALSDTVPGSREWLVHCGSLSKILSPGLRVGWLIAPEAMLRNAVMCKQFSDAATSTYAQATAAAYLASGDLSGALARIRPVYAQRAKAMVSALHEEMGDALEFVAPGGGLFVWARLTRPGANAQILAQRAIQEGVAFVPGAPFYAANPDLATLRLSFATADVATIREGVQKMAKAWRSL